VAFCGFFVTIFFFVLFFLFCFFLFCFLFYFCLFFLFCFFVFLRRFLFYGNLFRFLEGFFGNCFYGGLKVFRFFLGDF